VYVVGPSDLIYHTIWLMIVFQAAFDPRVLSAVCFFATDIHGATLGKGGDDSLARVRAGELTGKGELVVRTSSLC
jgi:carboxymethylenebutenolidase